MTKEEAKKHPELQIEVNGVAEDWFYVLLWLRDRVSDVVGRKAQERLKGQDEEKSADGLIRAYQMLDNLEVYGVPCASWAK